MTDADFQDHFYRSADGLTLHARVYGSANEALPVVCLPGLTRNARDFHKLALILSQQASGRRQVIAFDYRGRGQSDADPDWKKYHPAVEAGDIIAGLDSLQVRRALFIGTSRGGIILHLIPSMRPGLVAGAVLNDIGPAIEKEGLDQIRLYLGKERADLSLEQAIAAQKRIHGSAFPALGDADWTAMTEAIYRIEDGRAVPDFDAQLLKTLGAGDPDLPLPTLWKEFDQLAEAPLLVLRGANSALLSPETLLEMARRSDGVETWTVEGHGHPPLLEKSDLPERIIDFLERAERQVSGTR